MNAMATRLPEFDEPPVVEVAISLQFKAFESLKAPHLGLLWRLFREEGYSRVEEHGELEPAFEEFEGTTVPAVGIRIRTFDDAPPPPRVWFLNEAHNELIQVQRDRIVVNWRAGAQSEPYPRYPHILGRFRSALNSLIEFAASEQIGDVLPEQCEVTYVNHMRDGIGWETHGDLDHVVTTWQNRYSDEYLGAPEDVGFKVRYRMTDESGRALGRLHVVLQPAYRSADGRPIFVMNMIARGKPTPANLEGVFQLFDLEHEWIVRGFTSITTTRMHELWRRRNG
ncbi:MAG: TIGR04255 family protein [Bryobacteraceae bacterium]|jgi:uncharacterized protein (TIGR04255 family)